MRTSNPHAIALTLLARDGAPPAGRVGIRRGGAMPTTLKAASGQGGGRQEAANDV